MCLVMCLLSELLPIRVARVISPGFRYRLIRLKLWGTGVDIETHTMDALLLQLHHPPEHDTASSKEWPKWLYDLAQQ